jgi:hypothetical protein
MHYCDVMTLFVEYEGYRIKRTYWLALLVAEQNVRPAYPTLQDCNKKLHELANVCIYLQTEHNS